MRYNNLLVLTVIATMLLNSCYQKPEIKGGESVSVNKQDNPEVEKIINKRNNVMEHLTVESLSNTQV